MEITVVHRLNAVDDFARIDFLHRSPNGTHDSGGIALGAQHDGHGIRRQRHELFGKLHERIIELRLNCRTCVGVEPQLLHVAHHADDFRFHVEDREMDVLADGIFAGEIGARENVVDVDHHRRVFVVLRRDEAPALEGDSHGWLEAGFHQIKHRLGHVLNVVGLRLAVNPERQRGIMDHRAGTERDGNGFHAGNAVHFVVEAAQPRTRFRGAGCGRGRKRQHESDRVAGIEAGIDAPKRRQAANHQSRTDEQHQRHGYFDGDENSLQPVARAAQTAAALLEYLLQIHARSFQRGSEAKNNSGK